MGKRHMNSWEREQALEFYQQGVTVESVALWFDRGYRTIQRLIQKHKAHRGHTPGPGPNAGRWWNGAPAERTLRRHRQLARAGQTPAGPETQSTPPAA